jgi:hypothetical protein
MWLDGQNEEDISEKSSYVPTQIQKIVDFHMTEVSHPFFSSTGRRGSIRTTYGQTVPLLVLVARVADPDWIRIQSGQWILFFKFMFWSVGWPLLRAEGFFCNLDILYGGLGIGKLQFLIKRNLTFFQLYFFLLQFLVIKALDPDWIRIRIGIQPVPRRLFIPALQ